MLSKKSLIKIVSVSSILSAVAFGITLYNTQNVDAGPIYSQEVVSDVPAHDPAKLKNEMGIEIADGLFEPKITKEQAIEAANTEAGNLVSQAPKIHVTKYTMTFKSFTMFSQEVLDANPNLKSKGYIDNLPVWVVSYEGLNLPAKGGSLSQQAKPNTEYNVVVDATSGKPLVAFRYR